MRTRRGASAKSCRVALFVAVASIATDDARSGTTFVLPSPRTMHCDFTGDGIQDLVLSLDSYYTTAIRVQRMDGNGPGEPFWQVAAGFDLAGCADVNADGLDDLLYDGGSFSRLNAMQSNPTYPFHYQVFVPNGSGSYAIRAVGDVDGNGFVDLIRGVDGGAFLRVDEYDAPVGGGSGLPARSRFVGMGGGAYRLADVGDSDGDGFEDLVLEAPGVVRIDRSGGAGGSSYLAIDASERVLALRDTSGDGRADLITAGPGFTRIRTLDGATVLATGDVSDGGGAYPTRFVADANGDAKADLIGASDDGTFVRVALLDGVASPSRSYVGTGGGAFALRQAGDFSGDGKADLLQQGLGWVRVVKLDSLPASPEIVWVSAPGWSLLDFRAPLP